ncbi:MAG: HAMP domain-containing sensor histidine kinase [Saccharofermentanales bacterium]
MNNIDKRPVCTKISSSKTSDNNETIQSIDMIRQITNVMNKAATGDFSVRVLFPAQKSGKKTGDLHMIKNNQQIDDELLKIAKSMNSMLKKLERKEIARKNAISTISHDLKTPLTSMKGFVEGILDGKITGEAINKYLNIVDFEISRMHSMINSTMAEYDDKTQGIMKLDITEFDLNLLINRAVDEMGLLFQRKNANIILDTAGEAGAGAGLPVFADKTAIERVVYNLLDNAIKFIPQSGTIKISTRENRQDNIALVIIEDSGEGIAVEDYKRIFEKSFRGRNSSLYEGQGLGLYICKDLISAHNQKIWLEKSVDLGGAKFTFTLSTK